jgi:hypothetical protein
MLGAKPPPAELGGEMDSGAFAGGGGEAPVVPGGAWAPVAKCVGPPAMGGGETVVEGDGGMAGCAAGGPVWENGGACGPLGVGGPE